MLMESTGTWLASWWEMDLESSWGWIRRDLECLAGQLGFILYAVRE